MNYLFNRLSFCDKEIRQIIKPRRKLLQRYIKLNEENKMELLRMTQDE